MSAVMTYTNVNGYLIPNLTYKSGNQMEQLAGTLRIYVVGKTGNGEYAAMLLMADCNR